ncbi:uncharacterized protein MAM_08147 [Metarhizium album ARSEF 1941]|uniref:Uncharacterized protein n=1 Tax=Metarhizium album (strain ARSEF 1941) TaxID=1081103 RepID=A0A0B2WJC3_METAS|nr:uncharacterized protein MAM_08147 [Metarhizium album ARSEF 1941]KHN94018.1 hypothetical protein MAM_08147 [Metarhizium album ARSEF 1941]
MLRKRRSMDIDKTDGPWQPGTLGSVKEKNAAQTMTKLSRTTWERLQTRKYEGGRPMSEEHTIDALLGSLAIPHDVWRDRVARKNPTHVAEKTRCKLFQMLINLQDPAEKPQQEKSPDPKGRRRGAQRATRHVRDRAGLQGAGCSNRVYEQLPLHFADFSELWPIFQQGIDVITSSKPTSAYRVFHITGGRPYQDSGGTDKEEWWQSKDKHKIEFGIPPPTGANRAEVVIVSSGGWKAVECCENDDIFDDLGLDHRRMENSLPQKTLLTTDVRYLGDDASQVPTEDLILFLQRLSAKDHKWAIVGINNVKKLAPPSGEASRSLVLLAGHKDMEYFLVQAHFRRMHHVGAEDEMQADLVRGKGTGHTPRHLIPS